MQYKIFPRKTIKAYIISCICMLSISISSGTEYFVSPAGDDSASGAIGQPWKTIRYAVLQLFPGDVLNIREGVYTEEILLLNQGLANNFITIKNYNEETVILDGGNRIESIISQVNTIKIYENFPRYYRIRGLEFRNATEAGICIEGGIGFYISECIFYDNDMGIYLISTRSDTLEGNIMYDNSFRGIHLYMSDDNVISNNKIYRCGAGIICDQHSSYNTLINNEVFECGRSPIDDASGIQVSKNSIVYRNTIYGNEGIGLFVNSGNNNHIVRNIIYDNQNDGLRLIGDNSFNERGDNNVIVNNTIFDNHGDGIQCSGSNFQPTARNLKIMNNTVTGNDLYELLLTTWFTNNLVCDFNNWKSASTASFINYASTSYPTLVSFQDTTTGRALNSLSVDPAIAVDPVNGDFELSADSPLIDQGTNEVNDFLTFDLSFTGDTLDIGALEYALDSYLELDLTGGGMSKFSSMSMNPVPKRSPFVQDPRFVPVIPNNVVDWVLLQVREKQGAPPFVSQSLLLDQNGRVVNGDGITNKIKIHLLTEGNYFLSLRRSSTNLLVKSHESIGIQYGATSSFTFTPSNSEYIVTGIDNQQDETVPSKFILFQNYPNPFNQTTSIRYTLPISGNVQIKVLSLTGRVIRILVDERQTEGTKCVKWDGRDTNNRLVSSGVYIYTIESDVDFHVKKCILLK